MGFLTQYLGTATDSKGFVELMKQLRLDEAIAYLEDDPGKRCFRTKLLQIPILYQNNAVHKRRPRKSFHNTNHINIKEINYHHNQITSP